MRWIDLNADLGEGAPGDTGLYGLVSSANIACGGHAGDEETMREAVDRCLLHCVAIGAHPGYEDRENFGHRTIEARPAQLAGMVARQLETFLAIVDREGGILHHVKLHGGLYHQADRQPELAAALMEVVAAVVPGCRIYAPIGGALAAAAGQGGLRVCIEGFADRLYTAGGTLMPRGDPGALIEDIEAATAQALDIVSRQQVRAACGAWLALPAETLCVHGDNPHALELLGAIRDCLLREGFIIGHAESAPA